MLELLRLYGHHGAAVKEPQGDLAEAWCGERWEYADVYTGPSRCCAAAG